mmetsp:Transcript_61437/g.114887  ORF Transcript_61437/g.114887 Transcript_61437/m.114887 type:complete len:116 (-) Transcript_61437:272-619(-)
MPLIRSTFQLHLAVIFIFSQLHVASSLRTETAIRDEKPSTISEGFCSSRTEREVSQETETPSPPSSEAAATDGLFQDARLVGSFALGILFMHAMEVLKPGQRGTSRKFELYPYVL